MDAVKEYIQHWVSRGRRQRGCLVIDILSKSLFARARTRARALKQRVETGTYEDGADRRRTSLRDLDERKYPGSVNISPMRRRIRELSLVRRRGSSR